MLIPFNGSGVITVFLKSAFPYFALIKFLGSPSRNKLNALGNDIGTAINYYKVYVIGSNHIVKYTQTKVFLGFKQPRMPSTTVLREFQEKFLFVAAMGDVPHLPRYMVLVCTRHF